MRLLAVLCLIGVVVGCAGTSSKTSAPAIPDLITLSIEKPVLTLASGYAYTKEADGVQIVFAPADFRERTLVKRILQEKKSLITLNDQYTYKVTESPVIFYDPPNVGFTLKVTNNLSHVLRFKDCVITLSVDGKPYSAFEAEELLRTVIVPHQSWEGQLTGPDRSTMPNGCNIVFSIYDMVTEVDEANNPTKRTNFEWVFTYNVEDLEKQVEVKHYEKKMTREQAADYARGVGG